MKRILTRFGLALATVAVVIAGAAAFSAYEAHIVNVTATIDNALNVPIDPIDFGTVFPQEAIDRNIDVALSSSFVSTGRVDDVEYMIRQKPKCARQLPEQSGYEFAPVTENGQGQWVCPETYAALPVLCPYLSKHEVTTDGQGENDVQKSTTGDFVSDGINAFHGPITGWTMTDTLATQVTGRLAKSESDTSDTWKIDFRAPCFQGECAQDWATFVHTNNPNANPASYVLTQDMKGDLMGCDLWVEVTGVSQAEPRPTVGANLSAYVAPAQCSVTVSGGQSIQAGITEAGADGTVCVDPSYTGAGDQYPVIINEDNLILAGLGTAGSASLPGGVRIDNDDVTVKGLTIHNSNFTGEIAAVYLSAGVDNATVKFNDLAGPGNTTANSSGLINVTGFTTTGLTFDNNKSHDWLRGIFLNDSTNMTLTYNTLTGNGVGSANDHPHGNVLTNNLIKNNTIEGVGIFNDVGDTFTANINSIYNNNTSNSLNDLHNYGTVSVNAENNWWGDVNPADNVAGVVDYTPSAPSAYTEN